VVPALLATFDQSSRQLAFADFMALGRVLVPLAWACALAEPCEDSEECKPHYKLAWDASGASFFDGFDFLLNDDNFGAAAYLDFENATAAGIVEAQQPRNHARRQESRRVEARERQASSQAGLEAFLHDGALFPPAQWVRPLAIDLVPRPGQGVADRW